MKRLIHILPILILLSVLFFSSKAFATPEFDFNRAYEYLKKQCDFGPRPPGSPAHKNTRDYLISELKKYARGVTAQNFTQPASDKTLELTNIIAIFGPESENSILLSAHWDTRPIAEHDPDPKNQKKPIMGANDGASGVAVLLELARIFHENPPPMKIVMVLFDGEDYGRSSDDMFFGSRYFARRIPKQWIPDYGILLDMIGDKDLDVYIEQNSNIAARDVVQKVWDTARRLELKQFHNEVRHSIMDDHIFLIQAGIKCIDIIDFDYPYWHTLQDTADKCSPESLEAIGNLLLELIYYQY